MHILSFSTSPGSMTLGQLTLEQPALEQLTLEHLASEQLALEHLASEQLTLEQLTLEDLLCNKKKSGNRVSLFMKTLFPGFLFMFVQFRKESYRRRYPNGAFMPVPVQNTLRLRMIRTMPVPRSSMLPRSVNSFVPGPPV